MRQKRSAHAPKMAEAAGWVPAASLSRIGGLFPNRSFCIQVIYGTALDDVGSVKGTNLFALLYTSFRLQRTEHARFDHRQIDLFHCKRGVLGYEQR